LGELIFGDKSHKVDRVDVVAAAAANGIRPTFNAITGLFQVSPFFWITRCPAANYGDPCEQRAQLSLSQG